MTGLAIRACSPGPQSSLASHTKALSAPFLPPKVSSDRLLFISWSFTGLRKASCPQINTFPPSSPQIPQACPTLTAYPRWSQAHSRLGASGRGQPFPACSVSEGPSAQQRKEFLLNPRGAGGV